MIEIDSLVKKFPVGKSWFGRATREVQAISNVSFSIAQGETLGLVGESGCGKSTLGRCLLRLLEPTEGDVRYNGNSIIDLPRQELRALRRQLQIIFQDPYASLNPRLTVEEIIAEPLDIHRLAKSRQERRTKTHELMERCGLRPELSSRYPHEFSGGQRQRISIARALAVSPKFIVCDEPVSALDVSIQAQIINLLQDLQKESQLTYLFIAHDLNVVRHISDRIAVMYLGRIVEIGDADSIYQNPLHPYTQALLSAIPVADPTQKKKRQVLEGDVPSPIDPPSGCFFHPRCPLAQDRCRQENPALEPSRVRKVDGNSIDAHRQVACHYYDSTSNS